MRLPRVPRLRLSLPKLSPVMRANGVGCGVIMLTLGVMQWNTHAKPAGAYCGAVAPQIPDIDVNPVAPRPGASAAASAHAQTPAGPQIDGRLALRLKQAMLLDARSRLQAIPDYLATFSRQERVNGSLLPKESTDLKVRHAPFSVYMKWNEGADIGREILFVKGENDDRMLVKKGGKVGEMLPTFKLDPNGDLAMKECRHPVTESGLLNLVEKILHYTERDLKLDKGVTCQFLPDQKIDNRKCYAIRTDYGSAEIDADYRCSIVFVDQESSLPVCVKNYGWSDKCGAPASANEKISEETLVEFYAFTGIRFQSRLSPGDFDQANAQYHFRRN